MLIKRFVNSWRADLSSVWPWLGGNGLEYTVCRTFLLTLSASVQSDFIYGRGTCSSFGWPSLLLFTLRFLLIVQTNSGQSRGRASSRMRGGCASPCLWRVWNIRKWHFTSFCLSCHLTVRLTSVSTIALMPNDNTCNAVGDICHMGKTPYAHF